mmetsp:Transcript_81096/g.233013  ORF Transcript_81096/g.233013 Transcript_81096/m.233013 type:complete len:203 (-) Transcript_81096:102-710(-)|eukprot:CAMPEP_0177394862 /NCGR_PEP_ID=MMETSP0368-20130122/55792_1 /TAXON_ID=447022 ORGANISM="Scrippsiella hangoei-like, Strain SHHI-4" /NCGR_SAMPLE_ID=MMETSP0368 /ASSEMBLY_ACC=CAM_ASM_000363 /LENGTH=202 /DNA_ID=CAMNT_0018861303 /DNA_START=18 /DNA_END=626 /DNA_ORIENTATION=-
MAMMLMQQGSKGAMRDLDYINPRPKATSSALPPEIRARLGLQTARSSSAPPDTSDHNAIYTGAANAASKVGASGAGTDWQNPNGHAFVRRGTGIPMSLRASRKAQMDGKKVCTADPVPGRAMSVERRLGLERMDSVTRVSASLGDGGSNGSRPASRESLQGSQHGRGGYGGTRAPSRERRRVSLQLPPKAPVKTKSLPTDGP